LLLHQNIKNVTKKHILFDMRRSARPSKALICHPVMPGRGSREIRAGEAAPFCALDFRDLMVTSL